MGQEFRIRINIISCMVIGVILMHLTQFKKY